jgi:sporulation protein YlmC with PRC-barrel domain
VSPAGSPTTGAAAPASAQASTNTLIERRASTVIGMPVTSVDGTPIGEVRDIIVDAQGRATHVVIAYDTEPAAGPEEIPEGKPRSGADGKLAAVPWDSAIARINDGKLVLDRTKLQSAPSFTADEWPNLQAPGWSADADAYWRKVAPPPPSARRSAQVDSTARLRARPTRDGE